MYINIIYTSISNLIIVFKKCSHSPTPRGVFFLSDPDILLIPVLAGLLKRHVCPGKLMSFAWSWYMKK